MGVSIRNACWVPAMCCSNAVHAGMCTLTVFRRSACWYVCHEVLSSKWYCYTCCGDGNTIFFNVKGNISRQEAVSMIPPLLLNVKSNSRVCIQLFFDRTCNVLSFLLLNFTARHAMIQTVTSFVEKFRKTVGNSVTSSWHCDSM